VVRCLLSFARSFAPSFAPSFARASIAVALVVALSVAFVACGGGARNDGPPQVATVSPAAEEDAGPPKVHDAGALDAHAFCAIYERVADVLGEELDKKVAAGPITDDDMRAISARLSPEGAVPVVRQVAKERGVEMGDLVAFGRDNPNIQERCIAGMVRRLRPHIEAVARARRPTSAPP
jgi:hypothetical protein